MADGVDELVRGERLDEELARPGEHRSAEIVRFAMDRHHHDRGGGHGGRQLLRRGDPVHVRHVDVHQDNVGREANGHFQRLCPGRRGADHFDIALEAEQLCQVVASLRDVVHDEDTDLVGHWVLIFCL